MEPFEKTYNFDNSSFEWMKNKKALGNGTYKYICGKKCKSGKKCNKPLNRKYKMCIYHYKLNSS